MNDKFVVGRKFVGLTEDGKISLPKGSALPKPTEAEAKAWRGKLPSLMRLHHHCTPNGKKAGREGVSGMQTAQVVGDTSTQSKAATEVMGDALPQYFSQWDVLVDTLLERATDPVVFAVQRRIIHSEEILYSQLHRHLHHAVFADDDVIMLERMPRTALRGRFEASDMIGLLCWLAQDIEEKVPLPVSLPENIRGLAEDFADRHLLHHDASTFGVARKDTLNDLCTIFEEVRRYHPPVDADTEDIIEVIENYLYAGKKLENSGVAQHDNVLFGSDFFDVWEMLCLHHAYEKLVNIKDGWTVLIADGGNLPDWLHEDAAFKDTLVFDGGVKHEYFAYKRPDLILYQVEGDTVSYKVIDFKYYEWDDLRIQPDPKQLNDSEKKFFLGKKVFTLDSDIAKSWSYVQSLLKWHNASEKFLGKKISIQNEFWLPSDRITKDEKPNKEYSAGELHAKPITDMIDELLKNSPNLWLER